MTNEKLAIEYQQGDNAALSALWERTEKLIYKLCHHFYNRNVDRCTSHGVVLEDLFQESFFALADAARAYKKDKQYKFTSYLNYPLKNRFNALIGVRKKEPLNNCTSLNTPITEDSETEIGETIPDPVAEKAFNKLETLSCHISMCNDINTAIDSLEPQEQRVIRGRYYENKTLKELAELECTNAEKIRQLEFKGLKGLRNPKVSRKLNTYISDLSSFAYFGASFSMWKYGGSVQERIIERL